MRWAGRVALTTGIVAVSMTLGAASIAAGRGPRGAIVILLGAAIAGALALAADRDMTVGSVEHRSTVIIAVSTAPFLVLAIWVGITLHPGFMNGYLLFVIASSWPIVLSRWLIGTRRYVAALSAGIWLYGSCGVYSRLLLHDGTQAESFMAAGVFALAAPMLLLLEAAAMREVRALIGTWAVCSCAIGFGVCVAIPISGNRADGIYLGYIMKGAVLTIIVFAARYSQACARVFSRRGTA